MSNRSIHRLNLTTDYSEVITIAEDALDRERPVLILTRSYSEAKSIWKALYDRSSDRVVRRLNRDDSAAKQDRIITAFDKDDTGEKVLIGPGKRIGQGNDIQSVEVGINIARPGSGVNASLVQRLGRLLRSPDKKEEVEFYHVTGVQPSTSTLAPDGESFVRNITEFFAQVLLPDTDGLQKIPRIRLQNEEVSSNVKLLEEIGAERILAHDQLTDIEKAYASAITTTPDCSGPAISTDWFTEAFPEATSITADGQSGASSGETPCTSTTKRVELDPVILAVARMQVEKKDTDYSSTDDLIEAALDPFLDAIIGAEAQTPPEAYEITTDHQFGFSCSGALELAIQTRIDDDAAIDSADDFVQHALSEWLNISPEDDSMYFSRYQQYQSRIESLITNDHCPCSTAGEVIQAALEIHFDV